MCNPKPIWLSVGWAFEAGAHAVECRPSDLLALRHGVMELRLHVRIFYQGRSRRPASARSVALGEPSAERKGLAYRARVQFSGMGTARPAAFSDRAGKLPHCRVGRQCWLAARVSDHRQRCDRDDVAVARDRWFWALDNRAGLEPVGPPGNERTANRQRHDRIYLQRPAWNPHDSERARPALS